MARKIYDIQLGGKKMKDERFEYLALNIMLGGVKHRYHGKRIEYDGNYSNARTDMRAAEQLLKEQGYKPIKSRENENYHLTTENGDYSFDMVWWT